MSPSTFITISGLEMFIEFTRIKADPENDIEAGIRIETVCFAGREQSQWIEQWAPDLWPAIEKAVMDKVGVQ